MEGSPDSTGSAGNVADDDDTVSESENGDDTVSENDLEDQELSDIFQMLAVEKAGEFDFEDIDDSISLIQGEDDYIQMLQDYERANDRPNPVDDFPTDPVELKRYIREIAQALVNWDGAIDLTYANGRPTPAVNRIKKLKKSEIGLVAAMVLVSTVEPFRLSSKTAKRIDYHANRVQFAILNAQKGRSRGVYGDKKNLHPQKFRSWKDRYQVVLGNLKVGGFRGWAWMTPQLITSYRIDCEDQCSQLDQRR